MFSSMRSFAYTVSVLCHIHKLWFSCNFLWPKASRVKISSITMRENTILVVKLWNTVTKVCQVTESTFCELCVNVHNVVIISACNMAFCFSATAVFVILNDSKYYVLHSAFLVRGIHKTSRLFVILLEILVRRYCKPQIPYLN